MNAAKAPKNAEIERIFNQGSILRAHVLGSTYRQDRSKMGRRAGRVNDQNAVVVDGQMVGYWRGVRKSDDLEIEVDPWRPLTSAERDELAIAGAKYCRFLGVAPNNGPTFKIAVTT